MLYKIKIVKPCPEDMRKMWRSTVKWDMPRTSDLFSFFHYLNGYEFFIFVYCGERVYVDKELKGPIIYGIVKS